MKKSTLSRLCTTRALAGLAAALVLVPVGALAENQYLFVNAAACVPEDGTTGTAVYRSEGFIENGSATNILSLVCPYSVATEDATPGWQCALAEWRVKDVNDDAGEEVSCRLCSHGFSGSFSCGAADTTSGWSSSPQLISGQATAVDGATYVSQCDLPHDDVGNSNLYQLHLQLLETSCPI